MHRAQRLLTQLCEAWDVRDLKEALALEEGLPKGQPVAQMREGQLDGADGRCCRRGGNEKSGEGGQHTGENCDRERESNGRAHLLPRFEKFRVSLF